MTPFLFNQDPEAFLERQKRIRALLDQVTGTGTVNVEEWGKSLSSVQHEVDELPLVIGVTYRFKTLGGPMGTKHMHYRDEKGEELGLDLPVVTDPQFVEVQGRYVGRQSMGMGTTTIVFDIGGQSAVLADCDILRIEEVV